MRSELPKPAGTASAGRTAGTRRSSGGAPAVPPSSFTRRARRASIRSSSITLGCASCCSASQRQSSGCSSPESVRQAARAAARSRCCRSGTRAAVVSIAAENARCARRRARLAMAVAAGETSPACRQGLAFDCMGATSSSAARMAVTQTRREQPVRWLRAAKNGSCTAWYSKEPSATCPAFRPCRLSSRIVVRGDRKTRKSVLRSWQPPSACFRFPVSRRPAWTRLRAKRASRS